MKLRIAIVRHGLTEGNTKHLMSGHTDYPLISQGIEQLLKIKKNHTFPKYDRLYSSDLSRTFQTAKILFDEEVKPENRRFGLREIYFGTLEDKDARTMSKVFYSDFFGDGPFQYHAENGPQYQKRIMDEITTICHEMVSDRLNTVMIAAHAGTIRMLHYTLLKLDKKNYRDLNIDNGTGFLFEIDFDLNTNAIELLNYQTIGI